MSEDIAERLRDIADELEDGTDDAGEPHIRLTDPWGATSHVPASEFQIAEVDLNDSKMPIQSNEFWWTKAEAVPAGEVRD